MRVRTVGLLIFVFSANAFFAACTRVVDVEEERAGLLETDRSFAAASVQDGAAEAFNRYLSDDALQLPAGAMPVQGRETIYNQMKSETGPYTLAWDPEYAEVARSGDMGWTWGTYVYTSFSDDGEKRESHGKYLNVWKKQADGTWKVLVDMGNSSPVP